eukprot:8187219-Pyramimonas_sp.AAC.1
MYATRHVWFPPRVLAPELQLHTFARFLRQASTYGQPIPPSRSLVAGPRHANDLARAIMYQVLHRMRYMVPAATPSAWFDDVELRTTGSRRRTNTTAISANAAYARCFAEQGLEMADKS